MGAIALATVDMNNDGDWDVLSTAYRSWAAVEWHQNNRITESTLNSDQLFAKTIPLYPNPTSSEVYLNYATATNTNYSLYDISGKRLATYTQSGSAHQIDLSNIAKGSYILKASSGLQVNYYRILKN